MSAVPTTFGRARRRSAYRRLAHVVAGRRDPELLPFDEAERRLRPFARRYVGLRAIPVAQIVGTESRGGDFDRHFLPRRPTIGERWRRVEQTFPDGDFPPIVVYQLGDAYFVVDGHHRTAIARQRGMETIDAEVTELRSRRSAARGSTRPTRRQRSPTSSCASTSAAAICSRTAAAGRSRTPPVT
jgi:hypothetical protein